MGCGPAEFCRNRFVFLGPRKKEKAKKVEIRSQKNQFFPFIVRCLQKMFELFSDFLRKFYYIKHVVKD